MGLVAAITGGRKDQATITLWDGQVTTPEKACKLSEKKSRFNAKDVPKQTILQYLNLLLRKYE